MTFKTVVTERIKDFTTPCPTRLEGGGRKNNVQACILKEIRVNPMAYSDENGCVRLFWNVS